MRTRKDRRFALVPDVDRLEGRRLMAARAAQVRIQEVASGGTVVLSITGTNRPDDITIDDSGDTTAGNVKVTTGDGTTYISKGAVTKVVVAGNGGNDRVTYNLNGTLAGPRAVNVALGAGADTFTANLAGNVQTTGLLDLEAFGDAGNDTLTVNQTGANGAGTFFPYLDGGAGNDTLTFRSTGDVASAAEVGPALIGGAGNDTITLDYTGQVLGTLLHNVTIDGGAGNDTINASIALKGGSTGKIGADATAAAIVQGGAGNDQIRFAITSDPGAAMSQINAVAVGNAGVDTVRRSSIVQGSSTNENDSLL